MTRTLSISLALLLVAAASLAWKCPAPDSRTFAGLEIAFLLWSDTNPSFSAQLLAGARAAERDFGCRVRVTPVAREAVAAAQALKRASDTAPDGICVMGIPEQEVLAPFVDEAIRRGIAVTSYGAAMPALQSRYADQGFGFAGSSDRDDGRRLGLRAIGEFGLDAKSRVAILGSRVRAERRETVEGCMESLRAAGMDPVFMELQAPETPVAGEAFARLLEGLLRDDPECTTWIFDGGAIMDAAGFLESRGIPAGRVRLAGCGIAPERIGPAARGYIGLLQHSQPFAQGYLAVLQACLGKRHGFTGLNVDTGDAFVTPANARRRLEWLARGAS